MRVNNNRDSVELSNAGRTKGTGKAGKADAAKAAGDAAAPAGASGTANATGAAAGVEISSEAKTLSAAKGIAKGDSVDQAKIDKIKAMLANGTYKPDSAKVAEKVVNETMLQDLS